MSESAESSSPPKKHNVRYDLYRGHPNMNMLPHSEMKSIMSDFLQEDERGDSWRKYLNYGANAGDERFRLALRSFLDRRTRDDDIGGSSHEEPNYTDGSAKQDTCERELFITGGVSHGLELLCATLTKPGDEVWVERPTYFLAPNIFASHDLAVKPLPMVSDKTEVDADGCIGRVDIDRMVEQVENDGIPAPKMIYIIPSYHNPTGTSYSVKERRKLASFALRHNVLLVADEVYHLLDWEQQSDEQPTLKDTNTEVSSRRPAGIVHFNSMSYNGSDETVLTPNADRSEDKNELGCCISVSSFTKIWAPGVRLGWIDAPSFIIDRLKQYGYIDSQGGVAHFMGRIMAHAIESNLLDNYLDKLKVEYAERYRLVCNLLKEESRIAISHNSACMRQGGYFIWVEFPSGVNSDDFLSYSLENYGVKFMAGGRCDPFPLAKEDPTGLSIRSCARLCFTDLDREELIDATSAFLEAFRSFMTSK
ncbi:hypothetical protein ACHAXR_012552 [Thalassiosira sp. AJA248-18]